MKYTGRPHDGGGRGPSDEDGLRASNIFEGGPSLEQQEMLEVWLTATRAPFPGTAVIQR